MTNNAKLLSVVIPTRNRSEYARNLIASLQRCRDDRFEVIVRDNSDDAGLGQFVAEMNDSRLVYDFSPERLNMHQNFDQALALARGTYVCALGDDDGILLDAALQILARAD